MGKRPLKILTALVSAALMLGLVWAGSRAVQERYVFWNGTFLPKDAQSLNVSGKQMRREEAFLALPELRQLDARDTRMTLAQYEWFREELPRCAVLWDVPIQGEYYSQDTASLTLTALTPDEIHALQYLPALTFLDLGSWTDYDAILQIRQQYPRCTVRCQVQVAGSMWDNDVVSMVLENARAEELQERLPLFSRLESVLLTGSVPSLQELSALQEAFPQVFFLWKMEALGMTLETDMTQLDLTGTVLESVQELEALLPYFPKLKTVELGAVLPDQQSLVDLAVRNPDIHFVFDLTIGDHLLRTDAVEIDISNTPLTDTSPVEAVLPCFHDLKKVVMCECGISSEDMDALNKRWPDIRFVWSVDLGGMLFRTDAVHFTPNRWGLSLDDEDIYDLRYCTDMVCVDIGHNMKVTNCEWVAFMPELKYLVLAETGISDLTPLMNHENLLFLEIFLSRVKDYSPLTTCKTLEDLNLCYTTGDPAPIAEMTWLKRLWWSGSWIARETLKHELPDTYAEYLSISSTGRGWREGQHYYDMRDFIGMEYMVG